MGKRPSSSDSRAPAALICVRCGVQTAYGLYIAVPRYNGRNHLSLEHAGEGSPTMTYEQTRPNDFIREAVAEDLRTGRFDYVRTRLPPEPNG